MTYHRFGSTDIMVSVVGLGGHEFHPDGRVRGFGDDHTLAIKRGYLFPGFGGENREAIVRRALELGINLFDLTIDSEKEAMGRLLSRLTPSEAIFIQTRPEGMVYSYDPANRQMADYPSLREEVIRIVKMLGREAVDIFNFAFMAEALAEDPDYIAKIGDNIARLKREGLIRFASADTFSGEELYLKQIESGHFDSIFINYNPTERAIEERVLRAASSRGMAVLAREVFRKGQLFQMAEEAGITDHAAVARAAAKWVLNHEEITGAILGVSTVGQLEQDVAVVDSLDVDEQDLRIIDAICATHLYTEEYQKRRGLFLGT